MFWPIASRAQREYPGALNTTTSGPLPNDEVTGNMFNMPLVVGLYGDPVSVDVATVEALESLGASVLVFWNVVYLLTLIQLDIEGLNMCVFLSLGLCLRPNAHYG